MKPHKDAPAFDFFPERFWHAVEGWSNREIVQYMRLLSHQWTQDGIIPGDLRGLARGSVTDRVASKFPLAPDGKLRNVMLEGVRAKQRERIASRRLGSIITNAKRHGEDSLSDEDRELLANARPPKPQAQTPQPGRKDSVDTRGEFPDLSEYPTVETVKSWAEAVMAPPECAEKWHAEQVAGNWLNKHRNALSPKTAALRPLFHTYATRWKSFPERQGVNGKHRRSDFDLTPKEQTADSAGGIF